MISRNKSISDSNQPITRFTQFVRWVLLIGAQVFCLAGLAILPRNMLVASTLGSTLQAPQRPAGGSPNLADILGVHFIPGSSSTVILEQGGKSYLLDLAQHTIREQSSQPPTTAASAEPVDAAKHLAADRSSQPDLKVGAKVFSAKCAECHGVGGRGKPSMKTPDFSNPSVQTTMPLGSVVKVIHDGKPGTPMPAWKGKLSDADINATAAFVKSLENSKPSGQGATPVQVAEAPEVYTPADDYLFSLPTGRRLDRHGFYFNFTHRFAYSPAFSGTGEGDTLAGLDNFSISSFGLRFGVTDKLSVSAYRAPSLIGRPIELGVAYNFLDEHDAAPFNAEVRLSEDGQNDFDKNFTTNIELMLSRSIKKRAQLYLVPSVSLGNRELISKPGNLSAIPPSLPGINSFALGFGGAFDIRPSVAIVAEALPTLANGAELGIHRPAFAIGIQKRVLRHAFTLGFSNSPGTIVSQRSGTRATFTGDPSADTPSGLFIGFDLMRQIY